MKHSLLFKVAPAAYFGLPQEGTTVIPGGREVLGPTLDSRSGTFVAHGTLSHYRREEDIVSVTENAGTGIIKARDNFFTVDVDAGTQNEALRTGTETFEHFLRHLSVIQGDLFEYELLQIESDDGDLTVQPGPRHFQLARVTAYNTTELTEKISEAARRTAHADERLAKSLMYFEHGRFLFKLREKVGFFSPHFSFLLTSAYLQIWKAITALVGEPGTDSDYQSRYRLFGLQNDFWKTEVEPLYQVRNDFDVAHYSLDAKDIERVERAFGKAHSVYRTVVDGYSEFLAKRSK